MIKLTRDYRGVLPGAVGVPSPWRCGSTGDIMLPFTMVPDQIPAMLMDIFNPAPYTGRSPWYEYVANANNILKTRGFRVLGEGAYMTAYEYMGTVYKINNRTYTHQFCDGAYDWTLKSMYTDHRNTPSVHSVLRDGNRFCVTMEKLVYIQDYMSSNDVYRVFECIIKDNPGKLSSLLRTAEVEVYKLLSMLRETKGLTKAAYDLHDYNVMARPLVNNGYELVVTDPFCGSTSYTYAMTDGFHDTDFQ